MNINLQYLSQNQAVSQLAPSELRMSSGQSRRLSGAETPAPVLGISFFGQKQRALGSTSKLEEILQELESFADYDPIKGGFIVTRQRHYKYPVGSALGSKGGKLYQSVTLSSAPHNICNLHWLVWLWHTGSWPSYQLDHMNQNKRDNRIENLRDAHRSFNSKNTKLPSDNKSGYIGVTSHRNKWRSYTCHMGKTTWHGNFDTIEEAVNARAEFIKAHPEFGFSELHGKEVESNEVNQQSIDKSTINPFLKITL